MPVLSQILSMRLSGAFADQLSNRPWTRSPPKVISGGLLVTRSGSFVSPIGARPKAEAETGAVDANGRRIVVVIPIVVVALRIITVTLAVIDDDASLRRVPAFADRITHDPRLMQQRRRIVRHEHVCRERT